MRTDTFTTPPSGLQAAQVAERIARGEVNGVDQQTSRPLSAIIRANVFTRFNAILGVLFVAVVVVGQPADALFGLVVVWNALIGIVQEVRAKRTLDRLAVLSAPTATVIRDGTSHEISLGEVVLDDLVQLRAGDQVPADGVVTESEGLEIDESLLTGESDPLDKPRESQVLSGSIVVAGAGTFQATAVGTDSYAQRLAAETKRFTKSRSELMAGIDTLLRWISWALLVIGPVLLLSQLAQHDGSTADAVVGTVAALVGMVPEGLVLLTSIAFLVGALTLARRQVLVQELPAVEGLARVDVVCLDKTGTLTDGQIHFSSVERLEGWDDDAPRALGAMAADPNPNATLRAVAAAFPDDGGLEPIDAVPFSSARKWSATTFEGSGTWVMGAPEVLLAGRDGEGKVRLRVDTLAATGQRVVLLARARSTFVAEELPHDLTAVGLLCFEEQLRPDASDTMRYFQSQDVALKVLSGDNPRTVGAVAQRVDVPGAKDPIDARQLGEDDEAFTQAIADHAVFGRVSPGQKRSFVGALQRRGHVVAMTGDGVNDALALKDADIGVAMGNGAPATRAVAQIVLLDGRFSNLPSVVAEGRRVIANIERVASLFLIKNVYAAVLAIAVTVARVPYPFLPRHLTLVSTLTIGIPAFVLSLAPSNERYRPGFLRRVATFSVPTGILIAAAVFAAYALARAQNVQPNEARTAATVVVMVIGMRVLLLVARPLEGWKIAMVATMAGLFALCLVVPWLRDFFNLDISMRMLLESLAIGAAGAVLTGLIWDAARRRTAATGPLGSTHPRV